jgi:hypothetical protein
LGNKIRNESHRKGKGSKNVTQNSKKLKKLKLEEKNEKNGQNQKSKGDPQYKSEKKMGMMIKILETSKLKI